MYQIEDILYLEHTREKKTHTHRPQFQIFKNIFHKV